jgi:dienelactone hydrolase
VPRRAKLALSAVVVVAVAALLASPYVAPAAFILDLSGTTGWGRLVLPVRLHDVTTRDVIVPTRHGDIAGRLYHPRDPTNRSVIVFPGVHAGGVDEPRLAAFSRRLAASGIVTLSVPVPELRRYRITPAATDTIEDAAVWMAADRSLTPSGRLDIAGVSFAGGLALVAAGRPSLVGRVQTIVSLGGHADLPRVMRYLCTGSLDGRPARPPHDYGVAVILLGALPKLVPAAQVEPAERTIVTFLDASSLAASDRTRSDALFAEARQMALTAPEPARELLQLVNDRNVAALGARLLPYVEELGGSPALSPARSTATHARVFLIHGEADNVIPSTETPALASYLRAQGNEHVRYLLTPLLSHADVQPPTFIDAWKLIRFWRDLLDEP